MSILAHIAHEKSALADLMTGIRATRSSFSLRTMISREVLPQAG
ncbi:hypothetical protein N0B44_14685 [Roseibacterium beibuensis]|uniref:Uncharacterized protein n=1 Tax=[Roseibacterium] beibuensis TaxID=1193142 RepID=A0ABP9LAV1_9RHOB|nr:hypothetical protein [Roseibacterium beibuensis]MCS6624162.1 hypothetical protein [Roseibacterium beibuensis]